MHKHDTKKWGYLQVQNWYVVLVYFNKLGKKYSRFTKKTQQT